MISDKWTLVDVRDRRETARPAAYRLHRIGNPSMTLLFYVICWPALWRGPFLLTWHLPVIVWLSSQRWQWRRWWGSLCICRRRRKRRVLLDSLSLLLLLVSIVT